MYNLVVENHVAVAGISEHFFQFWTHGLQLLLDRRVLAVREGEGHYQSVLKRVVSQQPLQLPVDGVLLCCVPV